MRTHVGCGRSSPCLVLCSSHPWPCHWYSLSSPGEVSILLYSFSATPLEMHEWLLLSVTVQGCPVRPSAPASLWPCLENVELFFLLCRTLAVILVSTSHELCNPSQHVGARLWCCSHRHWVEGLYQTFQTVQVSNRRPWVGRSNSGNQLYIDSLVFLIMSLRAWTDNLMLCALFKIRVEMQKSGKSDYFSMKFFELIPIRIIINPI